MVFRFRFRCRDCYQPCPGQSINEGKPPNSVDFALCAPFVVSRSQKKQKGGLVVYEGDSKIQLFELSKQTPILLLLELVHN